MAKFLPVQPISDPPNSLGSKKADTRPPPPVREQPVFKNYIRKKKERMNSNQLCSLGTDKSKRGEPAVKERPLELAVQQVEDRLGQVPDCSG